MTAVLPARLLATLPAPLDPGDGNAPTVRRLTGSTLLVQRSDTELVTVTAEGEEVRFPAPWPRRYGTVAVAPGQDLAVFAGVHALRAVEPHGATRWEIRHGCWGSGCSGEHTSYEQYAADRPICTPTAARPCSPRTAPWSGPTSADRWRAAPSSRTRPTNGW